MMVMASKRFVKVYKGLSGFRRKGSPWLQMWLQVITLNLPLSLSCSWNPMPILEILIQKHHQLEIFLQIKCNTHRGISDREKKQLFIDQRFSVVYTFKQKKIHSWKWNVWNVTLKCKQKTYVYSHFWIDYKKASCFVTFLRQNTKIRT